MNSNEIIEPTRVEPATSLAITLAVINAILLRDIRVRAGPYYTGFLIILFMPLAHLVALLVIFKIFNKIAPVGSDQVMYFGISILPFVIYLYLSRRIINAISENRPLLYFSRVKIFDILFARGILEGGNSIAVFLSLLTILVVFSNGFAPRDAAGIVFAVAATIYFSFSIGVINALIVIVIPAWAWANALTIPLIWISSGVIFFPPAIPEPYNHWIALNPLLQCGEWLRYSYYDDYPDALLNVPYLFIFSTGCLALGLISEKMARRIMR
ncbi:ABC-2 type transporter [Methylocella silvestris BL2]|uniref:ABC-2 type transporter n=1 Tax=Methylocella silvestris (strain DSM 15510 / CIP 108128 / LMG 27833 / NCIMB 13906 / BL2) TaxID=395965 RepID=B8ERW0_METSB|nr:ABC-2 type transporter [Methylocella silvestris]ACK51658.1 ABC-2 type transporter [Methylocella silvestris BL2]